MLCPPSKLGSMINTLTAFFGLQRLLRELSVCLVAKSSPVSPSYSLALSACCSMQAYGEFIRISFDDKPLPARHDADKSHECKAKLE